MTCFLGVTNFDKPNLQGTGSLSPWGDLDDHLAMHRNTAERSISLSRSPETIEDVDCDLPEMPTRFAASDVLDLKKTEDKQLRISDHRRGPRYLQGTTSLATGNLERNPSGMHLHTLDSSTSLCRSSEVPREAKIEYEVSVLHLKTVKLDDQRL